MIMFAEGVFAGDFCLGEIKVSHNRKHLNIHPDYYPFWKNSLLAALEKNDPQFNDELRNLWYSVLDSGIKFIAGGYK